MEAKYLVLDKDVLRKELTAYELAILDILVTKLKGVTGYKEYEVKEVE